MGAFGGAAIGNAEGFASAAANAMGHAIGLREALDSAAYHQQQQNYQWALQQQADADKAAKSELDIFDKGGVRLDDRQAVGGFISQAAPPATGKSRIKGAGPSQPSLQGQKTLQGPITPNPAAQKILQEGGFRYKDPWGREYAIPKVTPQQQYTDLSGALEKGYQQPMPAPVNTVGSEGTPAYLSDPTGYMTAVPGGPGNVNYVLTGANAPPAPDWQSMPLPGGQRVYRPGPAEEARNTQELAARKAGAEAGARTEAEEAAKEKADPYMTVPKSVSDQYEKNRGIEPGSMGPMEVKKSHRQQFLHDFFGTREKPNIHWSQDDDGTVHATAVNTDTGKVLWEGQWAGRARTRTPTSGPKAITPAQRNNIEGRRDAANARADVSLKRALRAAETATDPDKARQEALDDYNAAKQTAQSAYERDYKNFGAEAPAPPAPPAPAGPPPTLQQLQPAPAGQRPQVPGLTAERQAPPAPAASTQPRKLNRGVSYPEATGQTATATPQGATPGGAQRPQNAPPGGKPARKTFSDADVKAAVAAHPGATAEQVRAKFLKNGWRFQGPKAQPPQAAGGQ